MKNTKKWLVLLLAGLLTLSSLVACGREESGEEGEGTAETEAIVPLSEKYKNLSPEKVYAALLEAEEVRITVEDYREYRDEQYKETETEIIERVIERDGNKVKKISSYSDVDEEEIQYYDLDNGRNYYRYYEEDGAWSVDFNYYNGWYGIVECAFFDSVGDVVDDDVYFLSEDESYEKKGNRYVVTAETINDLIINFEEIADENIDIQIEAYMDREENKYSYVFNIDEGRGAFNGKMTIEFTDVTVEFPDFGIEIEQDDEGFVYEMNDSGTYTVVDIGGTDKTDLVLPFTYKGKAVTIIGEMAFFQDSITSITIPDSVTSIGAEAFKDCDALTSIIIPDSVTSIGEGAFKYSKALTEITISEGVTQIGSNAFSGCDNLTSVIFENANGWTVDFDPIDLSDPAQAAVYLTDTYRGCTFERS